MGRIGGQTTTNPPAIVSGGASQTSVSWTHHLAVEGLRHKLLEVLALPLGRGLLGVHTGGAHGWQGQHVEGGVLEVLTYWSAATWG